MRDYAGKLMNSLALPSKRYRMYALAALNENHFLR